MLKGKIAVVTGGTRGIGYAVVRKYLETERRLYCLAPEKRLWIKH